MPCAARLVLERRDLEFAVVKERRGQRGVGIRAWRSTSTKSPTLPAPPDAMTGRSTASRIARSIAKSKPERVPSRSMLVTSSSPAPRRSASRAHSIASRPVGVRPPSTTTSNESPAARASIATTMHWLPKIRAAADDELGLPQRGRIQTDFVAARAQQRVDVVDRLHAAADRERESSVRPPRRARPPASRRGLRPSR